MQNKKPALRLQLWLTGIPNHPTPLAPLLLLLHSLPHPPLLHIQHRRRRQLWSLLKSAKCHKQGQYRLALRHPQIKVTLLWPNLPTTHTHLSHYLLLLKNYYPHLTPALRLHCQLQLPYWLRPSKFKC